MKKGMMTLVMFLTLPMFAELSGNFTFSSNYIWRGMTQTMDDPDDYVSVSYGDYNGYGTNFLVAYAFPLFGYDASVGYSDFSAEEGSEMEDEDSVFFTLGASF